jgi:hypothetical protein
VSTKCARKTCVGLWDILRVLKSCQAYADPASGRRVVTLNPQVLGPVWDGSNSAWSSSTPKLHMELALSGVGVVKTKCLAAGSGNNMQHYSMTHGPISSASHLLPPFIFSSLTPSMSPTEEEGGLHWREAGGPSRLVSLLAAAGA